MMHKKMKGADDEDEANKTAAAETDWAMTRLALNQPHPDILATTVNAFFGVQYRS